MSQGETQEQDDQTEDEPTDGQPTEDDVEEIEAERERRLDPENRPEAAEVDNTQRDFDPAKGMFTDADDYEQAEERYPVETAES